MTQLHFISKPLETIHGEITVPGDKSISHRSLIFGSIAKGVSTIDGFLDGDDCLATLRAFKSMGVKIHGPDKQRIIIEGVGKFGLRASDNIIDCGNSGTSIRLLAGLLSAQKFNSELTGDESLLKRPMLRISRPLAQMGADIETCDGKPPIVVHGNKILHGIDYTLPEASAQVKSSILLAGMYATGKTKIIEPAVSRDHTEKMLKTFSYPISVSKNEIEIDGNSECIAKDITIPGDISSAAFFIVAATIIPGAKILIRNVGLNPTRIGVVHILKQMGAKIHVLNQRFCGEEEVGDLQVEYSKLKGINIPQSMVSLAIDEFPILFVAAACAEGQTTLHGAKELRMKESDRIGTMVEGLQALGVNAEGFEDGVSIKGGAIHGGEVNSYGDHRIAMSFAIAGAVASSPVFIKNCDNVATSFPSFVTTANSLQFRIEVSH